MSNRHKWALLIALVVILLLAARVMWVCLSSTEDEVLLIARPYNEYTFHRDAQ